MEKVGTIICTEVVIKTFDIIYYTLITLFRFFFQKILKLYKCVLVSYLIQLVQ